MRRGVANVGSAVKVHYTFDRDAKVNCLARHLQTLSVQTAPVDETTSIGLVDLRVCIHAVMECSPELASDEVDYTIYALDYSEQDTPLVGQGMLSRALDSMQGDANSQQPKMVTGRVTKNLLGVFGGGSRETLEVRLKLSETAKVQRPEPQRGFDMQPTRLMETALTPTGSAEWNSFIQSNPHIGQQSHAVRGPSPALQQNHQPSLERRASFGPLQTQFIAAAELPRVAPVPVEPLPAPPGGTASRPSSRASNKSTRKSRPPTGRPRGRPRKKPAEGNTSSYEDATEGEETLPAKKRAKVTQVEKAASNPFGSEPESLRVAASTSGSLRNFRPINTDAGSASHLRDVPRAPTPVPQNPVLGGRPQQRPKISNLRRQSMRSQEFTPNDPLPYSEARLAPSPGQEDGRSPDSLAPTPNYSEDSPADIGSSPPIPRTTSFIHSSPPPSSPILPPMPQSQHLQMANFMSTDFDDLFNEDLLQTEMAAPRAPPRKVIEATDSSGVPFQVFRMESGPHGDRDMVNIRNYNTPQLQSAPMPPSESSILPPVRPEPVRPPVQKQPARKRKGSKAATRGGAVPTPPPTTDAVEKPATPTAEPEPMTEVANTDSVLMSISQARVPDMDTVESELPLEKAETETIPEALPKVDASSKDTPPVQGLTPKSTPENEPVQQKSFPLQNASAPFPAPNSTRPPRPLKRSQSAGPLMLPTVPASERPGPSTLSQSVEPVPESANPEAPAQLKRSASTGPLALPITASELKAGTPSQDFLDAIAMSLSDAIPPPPSSPQTSRSNKNFVKKHAIKQRLEEAIKKGEMPPFCSNCGAIQTPTWRKIWVQDKEGTPENVDCSEKPGRITAVEIVKRDADERPTAYRFVKKSLAQEDERSDWQELLLCNPCGIWLAKCKAHRPPDRWDKDAARLGQARRKRTGSAAGSSRSKKPRTDSDAQLGPTSEMYVPTDAIGPFEPSSPKPNDAELSLDALMRDSVAVESREPSAGSEIGKEGRHSNPGSTHSRESDKGQSPSQLAFSDDLGTTRRLLFPSPRKDDSPKVLGELDVNIVKTAPECRQQKEASADKENGTVQQETKPTEKHDDLEALFRSPFLPRPSTPPPNAERTPHSGPFKTPTRPTPSHRPITRSVSRSLRSVRIQASPSQLELLQQSPSMTPRSVRNLQASSVRRRSPRNHSVTFDDILDTPITRSITQLISESNAFHLPEHDLSMSSLDHLDDGHGIDWGQVLSTDGPGASSPGRPWVSFEYDGSADAVDQWTREQEALFGRVSR